MENRCRHSKSYVGKVRKVERLLSYWPIIWNDLYHYIRLPFIHQTLLTIMA